MNPEIIPQPVNDSQQQIVSITPVVVAQPKLGSRVNIYLVLFALLVVLSVVILLVLL